MDRRNRQSERQTANEATCFVLVRTALYKRLKAIVALPVVLALGAAAATLVLPKQYEATATVQIDPRQRSNQRSDIATPTSSKAGTDPDAHLQTIDAELGAIRSAPVVRRAVETLHLERDPEFKSAWPIAWLARLWGMSEIADTEAAVMQRMSVLRQRNTLLIGIRFSSNDAAKSARIANALANAYLRDWSAGRSSADTAATMMGQKAKDDFDGDGVISESERVFGVLLSRQGTSLENPGPSLVAKALPPRETTAAKPMRASAWTFAISLIAAIGVALLLELKVSTHASRIETVLACEYMTSLPSVTPHDATPARACRSVVAEPAGVYAEAVRVTCRELESRREGAPSRLTLVVSALDGEGAECLASNIAHQYALAGHAPLLIDGDLRTGRLTRQLAGQSASGLLDQVTGHKPVEEAILRDSATGLNFLPACGPTPIPIPVRDVLQSKAFAETVKNLKQTFVTIVMAAPPLLTVDDSQILAELADHIVFVTAWQKTPKRQARKALAKIAAYRSKLVGAALTEIPGDTAAIMSLYAVLDEMRRATFPPARETAA